MKPDTPLVTMREDERVCFDRAMDQWLASIKRLDLSEKDRVKGALLAYQRQAFVFHEKALLDAHQRGRQEGMEEADKAADWLDEAATEVEDWGAYAGAYFQEKHDLEGCVQEIRERASFIRAKAQEVET